MIGTRQDEDKFLHDRIAMCNLFDRPVGYDDIIHALDDGTLKLELTDANTVRVLDDKCIDEINKTLPFLRRIIDKPRTFIRSYEEKVPVETAKRINHKAIAILSRDSNDWYARTILTVKPKVITADMNEETIDIYENRFIYSLIERISETVKEARQECEEELRLVEDEIARKAIDERYHIVSTNSFKFCRSISKKNNRSDSDYEYELHTRYDRLILMSKQVSVLKHSDFCKFLSTKRKVRDPIEPTNPLMFDQSYNKAFRLWKYLNDNHWSKRNRVVEEEYNADELQDYYTLYCFLCICASFKDLKFEEISRNRIFFDGRNLKTEGNLFFIRRDDTGICSEFKCCVKEGKILLTHRIGDPEYTVFESKGHEKTHSYQTIKTTEFQRIELYPNYQNLEDMDCDDISSYTERILNGFEDGQNETDHVIRYAMVSINMTRCFQDKAIPEHILRRFFSKGEGYSSVEPSISKWGSYRTGFVGINPSFLLDNFFNIEKMLNMHIVKKTMSDGLDNVCPFCSGTLIKQSDGEYICKDCKRLYSYAFCCHCDPEKNNRIFWVKYQDDKFLDDEKIINLYKDKAQYAKLDMIDTLMKECTLTSFDIVPHDKSYKLVTICPRCGNSISR